MSLFSLCSHLHLPDSKLLKIQILDQKKQTKVIDDELNPTWNETLVFDLQNKPLLATDEIKITVKDFDKVTPDK